jgi:hypothetical protein
VRSRSPEILSGEFLGPAVAGLLYLNRTSFAGSPCARLTAMMAAKVV